MSTRLYSREIRPKTIVWSIAAMSLTLLSCTSGETIQSAPAEPPENRTEIEIEADEAVEPGNRFVRIDADSFAHRSSQILINDAVGTTDKPGWMFVGAVEDGVSRSRSAVVSIVYPDDDSVSTLSVLPSDGLTANATTVRASGDRFLVGGHVVEGGKASPTVWTFASNPEDATSTELPTTSPNATVDRFASGSEQTVLIGSETLNGRTSPAVWRLSGSAWESIPIAEDELDDTENVIMSAATVWQDQLVIVGTSFDPTRDPIPKLWSEQAGQLETVATFGLPESGFLNDVAVNSDQELVLVGATTIDAISAPLVASASLVSGPWSPNEPLLETYGSRVTSGFGFQRVLVDGDDLWATVTEPFLQQLHHSTDDGETWETDGDLSDLAGNNLVSNGFALGQDDHIVVAGGDIAVQWNGGRFDRLEDDDVLLTQSGELDAADIHVAGDSWFIVGTNTARTSTGFDYSSTLWRSPDGIRWGSVAIDGPQSSIGVVLHERDDEAVTAVLGGSSFYLDPVYLTSPNDSGLWATAALDIPEPALRLLPVDAANGPSGSILLSGGKLVDLGVGEQTSTRTKPLFLIVEPDGSSREALLTSSPVDEDLNGFVNCMAGQPGDYMAVLSWANRRVEVAESTAGERWGSTTTNNEFDGLEVNDCLVADDERIVVGQNADGFPVVATSTNGGPWDLSTFDQLGAAYGVAEIDDEAYLVGWTESDLGSDGAVWRRSSDQSWVRLDDLGLESDEFSENIAIRDLAENNGVVVAIGVDQGRAGVWMASTEVFSK